MEPLDKETHDKFGTIRSMVGILRQIASRKTADFFTDAARSGIGDKYADLGIRLDRLEMEYALETSDLILKNTLRSGRREELVSTYRRAMSMLDVDFSLGELGTEIKRLYNDFPPEEKSTKQGKKLGRLIYSLENMIRNGNIGKLEAERYNTCSHCGVEMHVDTLRSELRCPMCNRIKPLVGTVFDESQLYSQEGQKAKSGKFKPSRHREMWLKHIQGLEPEDELTDQNVAEDICGIVTLEKIRRIIRQENMMIMLMSVDDYRTILEKIGRTDLYRNIPLIMRKISGFNPPKLEEKTMQKIVYLFSKIVDTSGEVSLKTLEGRKNHDYYPYYLFKIIEYVIPENDPQRRILYYIYLQGDETLAKDDIEWKERCQYVDEIKYRPTIRSITAKYCPANYIL